MSEKRCETCRFWDYVPGSPRPNNTEAHDCRIRPPTSIDRGWVATAGTDWCGEHEARTDTSSDAGG